MKGILEQYRITDFLDWHKNEMLEINPTFQRKSVWPIAAQTYLIDSVLNGYPIPKVYMRTKIDPQHQVAVREIIDGQQRMRAILDFAQNKFVLTKRSENFCGFNYSTLDEEQKTNFLTYAISVEQLTSSDDSEVLEVFARLNSYGVRLNPPELRHAEFLSEFKWAVHKSSQKWKKLWESYHVLSVRDRVRMKDDSLMAEMYGIFVNGVTDGGESKITSLYKAMESNTNTELVDELSKKIDNVLEYFCDELADSIRDTGIMRAPHFLMLFAALAHARVGIPQGNITVPLPPKESALRDLNAVRENLLSLAVALEGEILEYKDFYEASRGTTHRIKSREPRFFQYFDALTTRKTP